MSAVASTRTFLNAPRGSGSGMISSSVTLLGDGLLIVVGMCSSSVVGFGFGSAQRDNGGPGSVSVVLESGCSVSHR